MEPVKKSEAPDYYEVIRFPIGEAGLIPPFSPPIAWDTPSAPLEDAPAP